MNKLFIKIRDSLIKLKVYMARTSSYISLVNTAMILFLFLSNLERYNIDIEIQDMILPIFVVGLFGMLLFGFLGEINKLDKTISFSLGSIMFSLCYYTIYKNFLGTATLNQYLFYITFIIWSLYGIASLLPYVIKNVSYNILDIFSKNVNGLFIFGYILFITSSSFSFFSSFFLRFFNL